MGRIKTPAEAKLTASNFMVILISAFTSAAVVLLLQYEDVFIDLPFPLDGLVFIIVFLLASVIGILMGLFVIKTYNRAQRVF